MNLFFLDYRLKSSSKLFKVFCNDSHADIYSNSKTISLHIQLSDIVETMALAGHLEFFYTPSSELIIFSVVCLIISIYFGSQQRWTGSRIWNYVRYILKIYSVATFLYIVICLAPTYATFAAPNSNYSKFIAQIRECGYRFKENDCATPCIKRSNCARLERECFALAICLRQPLSLLRIHAFLEELLVQIWSKNGSSDAFVILTGTFVVWGLLSRRWMDRDDPANNTPAVDPQAPPPPGPNGPPIVAAAAPNNLLGINAASVPHTPVQNRPVANQAPVVRNVAAGNFAHRNIPAALIPGPPLHNVPAVANPQNPAIPAVQVNGAELG